MARVKTKKKTTRTRRSATPSASGTSQGWFLERADAVENGARRIALDRLPFRIGRHDAADATLPQSSISAFHAELYIRRSTGTLCVRDLESTNGTFVNHERVQDSVLAPGDVLQLADLEFRVGREMPREAAPQPSQPKQTLQLGRNAVGSGSASGEHELLEMIRSRSIVPVLQPIVRLPERTIDGYEVLSRGQHPDLTESPSQLLQIAARLGLAGELSRLFRSIAIEALAERDDLPTLFLNTHPDELRDESMQFVADLRTMAPERPMVLEIHETALTNTESIRDLRLVLTEHRIGLAFDDFGAGQARVVHLAEVPPDYLKFDRTFVSGIDSATESKRHVLSSIVTTAHDLGVYTVAEGIETEDEAEVCVQLGFTHAQGYLFGRPRPIDEV